MPRLVILTAEPAAALPRLLGALGAEFSSWPQLEAAPANDAADREDMALILSEPQLVEIARAARERNATPAVVLARFARVLLYPFGATPAGLSALSQLVGATVDVAGHENDFTYRVKGPREICGPFTGLQFGSANRGADRPLRAEPADLVEWLVTLGDGGVVGRCKRGPQEIFVNATTAVFDVAAGYTRNLDAAACFTALVPLLWFIRHCGTPLLRTLRPWANWIIDDPTLTRRYGFIRIDELATAVSRVGAAVTIAFIPWNHRRTVEGVVNLFRARWPQLSICVHGCNHTRSEFAINAESAAELGALAMVRMRQLEADTTLGFEKVMVFPQGKFSHEAMTALRKVGLLAAVNTELMDARTQRSVTGADLLQPAVTGYAGWPLFLRRPAGDPLANFALDLLLGKPCLLVTHHDFFQDGVEPLLERKNALQGLESALVWTSLGEGISSTAAIRTNRDRTVDVRLFADRTYLRTDAPSESVSFTKWEPAGEAVRVLFNREVIPTRREGDELHFQGLPSSTRYMRIDVECQEPPPGPPTSLRGNTRIRIAARRYLSEFRDNYVDRTPPLRAAVATARKLTRRRF